MSNNKDRDLDFRSMNLAVFRGDDPGGVLWQPRLEFWYAVNKKRGALPKHLQDLDLVEIYDYCHASVRYFGNGLRVRYRNVKVTSKEGHLSSFSGVLPSRGSSSSTWGLKTRSI